MTSGACSSATTTTAATITVSPLPVATISVTSSSCFGEAPLVTISGTTGDFVTYISSNTSTPTRVEIGSQAGSNNNYTFNATNLPVGNTTFTITKVEHGTTCPNNNPNASAQVTVYANPTATIAANNNVQIGGPALQLTATFSGGTGTWSKDNNNLTLGAPSGNTINATARDLGTTTVTYNVSEAHGGGTTCTGSAGKVVNITAQYVTRVDGAFSAPATWNLYNQTGFQQSSTVPSNTNSIDVKHALTLDADYSSDTYFAITEGGTMTIEPKRVFASGGGTVKFNDKSVTVRSDVTGSGAIGKIVNGITDATNVTAERYTDGNNGTAGRRAWRLITAPVTGVSIKAAWQEGLTYNAKAPVAQPTTYGTLITGESLDPATAASRGYDYVGGGNHTSIDQYTPGLTKGTWVALADNQSTINPQPGTLQDISIQPAYLLFVRGDRTKTSTTAGSTTLRATGTLKQGTVQIGTINPGHIREVAGNPYASAIDFNKVYQQNATKIDDRFAVWVARLGVYGAYTYVFNNGGVYTAVPNTEDGTGGGGSITNPAAQFIQTGEGFMVYPIANFSGTNVPLTLNENAKAPAEQATGAAGTFREGGAAEKKLWVNLKLKNSDGTATVADGFLARFDASFAPDIDGDDANKPSNLNENLGILSHGSDLIVEARPDVVKTDTVQMKLWNTSKRSYQLTLRSENFDSLSSLHAYLEDSYLDTKQELSLKGSTTTVDFTVNNDTASSSQSRFRIVFQNDAVVLPVTLTKVSAAPSNGGVSVTWTVTNEVNIKGYTVERSTDGGTTYTSVAAQAAKNNGGSALTNYSGFDALPKTGDNLYRIRIEANNGAVTYSSVVKVTIGAGSHEVQITLYPNPVRSNGKVNLQLTNLAAGNYLVSVYSGAGQTVYQRKVTIAQSNTTQSEELKLGASLAQGSYPIKITDSKGTVVKENNIIVTR